ncbi:MAG: potassium channel family protein [Nocardioides sp.]
MARFGNNAVAVIGLGRFGEALALELEASGTEVLGIDTDEQVIQKVAGVLTHAVIADATDAEAMRQLSVDEFSRVVIGIGHHLEASILTCSVMQSFGIPDIWAKAVSEAHARILTQVGCHHVVRPEYDTGRRVAHLLAGHVLDYIEFDDGYAMVKMRPPGRLLGRTLAQSEVRERHGVTIVGVKPAGEDFTYAVPETVLNPSDLIIVSGSRSKVETFAELNAP